MAYPGETPEWGVSQENIMETRDHVLEELRAMFRNVLAVSASGGSQGQHAHVRGCVDGYMRALLDLGVATRGELLGIVAVERERANGPALGILEPAHADEGVAA